MSAGRFGDRRATLTGPRRRTHRARRRSAPVIDRRGRRTIRSSRGRTPHRRRPPPRALQTACRRRRVSMSAGPFRGAGGFRSAAPSSISRNRSPMGPLPRAANGSGASSDAESSSAHANGLAGAVRFLAAQNQVAQNLQKRKKIIQQPTSGIDYIEGAA